MFKKRLSSIPKFFSSQYLALSSNYSEASANLHLFVDHWSLVMNFLGS